MIPRPAGGRRRPAGLPPPGASPLAHHDPDTHALAVHEQRIGDLETEANSLKGDVVLLNELLRVQTERIDRLTATLDGTPRPLQRPEVRHEDN